MINMINLVTKKIAPIISNNSIIREGCGHFNKSHLFCHMYRLYRRWDDNIHIGYLGRCRKELRNHHKASVNVWRYLPRISAYHNCQQAHTRPQRKERTGETVSKRLQQRPTTCSHTGTDLDIHCIDYCYMNTPTIPLLIDEKKEEQTIYEVQ
jgi:hypothetical protein